MIQIINSNALDALHEMPNESVHCCVTSPPYWGLRDYGIDGQLGLEKSPKEYVEHLVEVFSEVRRVLRNDGTLWLNLGDSYCSQGGPEPAQTKWQVKGASDGQNGGKSRSTVSGLKPKDLIGIPWRVAFALQADGWWLRSDIIWHKLNPMPESVVDRPTKAHEYLFLLSKSEHYYYDGEAIKEPALNTPGGRLTRSIKRSRGENIPPANRNCHPGSASNGHGLAVEDSNGLLTHRNKRTVWSLATEPFPGAHFAVFPTKLIEPCILAGSPIGGLVLDPFCGSGTTGLVALRHNRQFIGIELKPEYCEMALHRIKDQSESLKGNMESTLQSFPK